MDPEQRLELIALIAKAVWTCGRGKALLDHYYPTAGVEIPAQSPEKASSSVWGCSPMPYLDPKNPEPGTAPRCAGAEGPSVS